MSSTDPKDAHESARINQETAKIPFAELQRFFASGHVILVAPELDLVEVAAAMSRDDTLAVETWIRCMQIEKLADAQAQDWLDRGLEVWAVVVKPWILVQDK